MGNTMTEQIASTNGVELCYETLGDPADPALLMVMGLGAQMIFWPDDFCEELAGRGFRLVRFDNRDSGRSSWIDGPAPDLLAGLAGDFSSASYTLEDMADDAAGLLAQLEIKQAHVVGVSMGGMIAQTLAIRHPQQVRSLASLMSTTGDDAVGQPRPDILQKLLMPGPTDRDGYVEWALELEKAFGSPGFEPDEAWTRDVLLRGFERGFNPLGVAHQLLAIGSSGDRTPALRALDVPTVVVHGDADPLVAPSGGEATAAAIPDATLVTIEGMGHNLPRGAWPQIIDAIAANAAQA